MVSSLYLDGTGFVYKTNPMDQAFSPKAKEWRRTNEGLNCRCTNKGKKKGLTQAKFMVAISYDRRVVTCEQYRSICGPKFAKMTDNCLPKAFDLSIHFHNRRFVQDGNPSKISAGSKEIMENLGYEMVTVPARNPDINCIENFFDLVEKTLDKNITRETFQEFSTRAQNIIVNFD